MEGLCQCGVGRGKQSGMGEGNKLARASLNGSGSLLIGGGGKREIDMPKVVCFWGAMSFQNGFIGMLHVDGCGSKKGITACITKEADG